MSGQNGSAAKQIPPSMHAPTTSALEQHRIRLEPHGGRSTYNVKSAILRLPRIGVSAAKCIVGPLKDDIRYHAEDGGLVDGFFLYLDRSDLAKSILIVLEDGSRQELIDDLRLSACECHLTSSPC
jgi:hypothetical protein